TSTLTAGNDIVLDNADDFGGAVSIVTANNVTLNDVNSLVVAGIVNGSLTTTAGGATTFGLLSVAGNLTATGTGSGNIIDTAPITVGGITTLNAGLANNILLTQADDF